MDKMKTVLGKILLEVPAIVLAVFLALAVNNCNEESKQHKAASQTMEAIFKEIQENKAALENNLADNRATMVLLEVVMDSLKPAILMWR
jgi:Skp family chaperone for outer membrane proteins